MIDERSSVSQAEKYLSKKDNYKNRNAGMSLAKLFLVKKSQKKIRSDFSTLSNAKLFVVKK